MLNLAASFANTAGLVEKEIVNLGFSHHDGDTRRGWMAYKAVSHFNFHQSFEILIKLILRLEKTKYGSEHRLRKLYEELSKPSKKRLHRAYRKVMDSTPPNKETGIGYAYGNEPPPPPPLENVTDIEQGLCHFDSVLRLYERRYEYENIDHGEITFYLFDLNPWIDIMISDVSRYAHDLLWEKRGT